ncbi:hypothetical protein [Aquimarina muelleri]|uniref:Uncharacterized protein n=1 Tax=Aquimarina muelleri TaxID=279356 RepID=A0A918JZ23_9FLAO|nr:hypothetical protein [Aquimarina muelleri]MCX2764292.1 hypothetical protein [Aquimarina muelleri]GGX32172.1 hypothetical protein GCM10007384_36380 [Aquimarina muelleri]
MSPKHITKKYNGKARTDLSKTNFFGYLNTITTPKTIETIKNGVGRLIPNGSKKKAIYKEFQKVITTQWSSL